MALSLKDAAKLLGICVVTCCAAFVCTLFLSYNIDLAAVEEQITSYAGRVLYEAQVSMGKVTVAVTGGCLVATTAVMLMFYVKNYIDAHAKELGIMKALGYSSARIAGGFWVFGLSALFGCALGYGAAYAYLPEFYRLQNAEGLFALGEPRFHAVLPAALIAAPTIAFSVLAVLYALKKLRTPVLALLRESREHKPMRGKDDKKVRPFLKELRGAVLKEKKTLVFFMVFSAFCFSAMVQMSLSMREIASETFAFMIITIGLILAFMTLLMTLSSVVKANSKTIAMLRVFGYDDRELNRAVLGGYRPFSYLGFAIGTVYQYALLKLVMTFVFADIENMPEYNFSFKALAITLAAFVITYEAIMYCYSMQIKRQSVKSVMLE